VCVLLLAGVLYQLYYMNELFERIRMHLRLLVPLEIKVHPQWILRHLSFWVEIFVNFLVRV
jgi:hypothetical protein